MKCNVGKSDKIVRLVVGLGIIAAGVVFKSWWGAIGLVPVVTALLGHCPLYLPLKISSCRKENS